MKIKAIITGATGMVGEGVLLACLNHPEVESVLLVNRKRTGIKHSKVTEVILPDFFKLDEIKSQLVGYNACFFCLGVSSVGMTKEEYSRATFDLTINFAKYLKDLNPDLAFCYVTGAGTDSSEKGRVEWARTKGKTENALMQLFKNSYMFRPGFMKAMPGQKNVKKYYKYINWTYPIGRTLYPAGFCTLEEVALAMIKAVSKGNHKHILEVKDIVQLSQS